MVAPASAETDSGCRRNAPLDVQGKSGSVGYLGTKGRCAAAGQDRVVQIPVPASPWPRNCGAVKAGPLALASFLRF